MERPQCSVLLLILGVGIFLCIGNAAAQNATSHRLWNTSFYTLGAKASLDGTCGTWLVATHHAALDSVLAIDQQSGRMRKTPIIEGFDLISWTTNGTLFVGSRDGRHGKIAGTTFDCNTLERLQHISTDVVPEKLLQDSVRPSLAVAAAASGADRELFQVDIFDVNSGVVVGNFSVPRSPGDGGDACYYGGQQNIALADGNLYTTFGTSLRSYDIQGSLRWRSTPADYTYCVRGATKNLVIVERDTSVETLLLLGMTGDIVGAVPEGCRRGKVLAHGDLTVLVGAESVCVYNSFGMPAWHASPPKHRDDVFLDIQIATDGNYLLYAGQPFEPSRVTSLTKMDVRGNTLWFLPEVVSDGSPDTSLVALIDGRDNTLYYTIGDNELNAAKLALP